MESHIIINKKIYEKYKSDILPLNARLFVDNYFYNLSDYEIPFDLKGIENYIMYVNEINIYTTSTFLDFVNVLLVLSFLLKNNYKGKVNINYYLLNESSLNKAMFSKVTLKDNDYKNVDETIKALKNETTIDKFNINLPGAMNFINFYNMIIDENKFMMSFQEVIDDFEEDENEIALYLETKYSNIGLDKEFYLKILKKYM